MKKSELNQNIHLSEGPSININCYSKILKELNDLEIKMRQCDDLGIKAFISIMDYFREGDGNRL